MPFVLLMGLVVSFPVVDLAMAALYAATDSPGVGNLRLLRDGVALALFATALWQGRLPKPVQAWLSGYLLILLLYLAAGLATAGEGGLAVSSAGQLALPMILLLAGLAGVRREGQLAAVVAGLTVIALASAGFALWERENTEFWTDTLAFDAFLYDIKGITFGVAGHYDLPFNFYGYDQERRAAGLLAAPLAQGSFLAVVGLLAFSWYRRHTLLAYGLLAVCAIGVYHSGTRGAMAMMAVAAAAYMVFSAVSGRLRLLDLAAFSIGGLLVARSLYHVIRYTVDMTDGSTEGHVDSLWANLENLDVVMVAGHGLGHAGAIASQSGVDIAGGGEGAVFSIAYQIGLPGALAFLGFYLAVVWQLYRRQRQPGRCGDLARAGLALMIGAMGTMVTSEHLLTFSGMAALWLVVGGILAWPLVPVPETPRHPRRRLPAPV